MSLCPVHSSSGHRAVASEKWLIWRVNGKNLRVPYRLSGGPWFSISAFFAFFSLQDKLTLFIWMKTLRGREGKTPFCLVHSYSHTQQAELASFFMVSPPAPRFWLGSLVGGAWHTVKKQ